MKGQTSTRTKVLHALMIVVLTILLLLFIAPFILVVINVFKTKADINTAPLALIGKHGFTLENFPRAMDKMNFVTVFGNSAVITISATILTILFSAMCAYVIVRNPSWKFGGMVFALMVASMVIPFQVLMVPLVSVYGGLLDVLNSRITLILMHTGFSVSLAVFMFHGAIKTNIPNELEEAASIDGCSKWRTFWTIVFPLLKPTVATVAIIDAMAFWNDYLLPSLVLGRRELYTIPIATQIFYGTYSNDIGLIMARRMVLEGAKVQCVAELRPQSGGLKRNIVQCLDDFNIPLYLNTTVAKIHGKDRVEGVTLTKVDDNGRPIPGSEWDVPCDTLLLSCGLIPENELTRGLGADMDGKTGGPVVGENLECSIPGVFACGNVLHVHELVDHVSAEAEKAGNYAVEYIRQKRG